MASTPSPTSLLAQIKRKSQFLADVHGQLADQNRRWQNVINYSTLLASVTLLALTFVSHDFMTRTTGISSDGFIWLNAIMATVSFFAGICLSIWRPLEHEAQHQVGVRHYSGVLYAIRQLEERGNVTSDDVKEINRQYLDDRHVPPIPDRCFLKLKQRYLIKRRLSEYLDSHPSAWITLIRLQWWLEELGVKRNKNTTP